MRVGFEIKGSKPKSSVNRLNLFKVLIVSSTSFLQRCAICSSDSSSSFSSPSSVITSAGCSGNSETIYSIDNGRDWLVPSRKGTSKNVELNGNFFVRSIFLKLSQCFILCFWSHFVMLSFCGHSEHNTLAIFFHALIFKTIKQRKDLQTFELENSNMKSSRIRSPWHHSRQEGKINFLNQNLNYTIKNRPGDQRISSI